MQLFPILVVAVVLAADGGLGLSPERAPFGNGLAAAAALAPVALILLLAAVGLRWCRRRLTTGRTALPILHADRIVHVARVLLLVNHAVATLLLGWVAAIRDTIGSAVLLDEIVAIIPPIVGVAGLWWLHYPIERRIREALLIRRLDSGKPIYRIPSRAGYVLQHLRLNVLLLLVPILVILALAESIRRVFDAVSPAGAARWPADAATFVAALGVFVLSPLIARGVLSLEPLAAGVVRDDLTDICRRHRVRIRQFFLWRTNGTMLNAAVMGLISPLRYVLLTDSLVDTMTREQVQAVMAHEIGHIRRHHMPWLVTSLLALLLVAGFVVSGPLLVLGLLFDGLSAATWSWIDALATAGAGAAALLAFGWVSRRYERQADTFAVQHLSGLARADVHAEASGDVDGATAAADDAPAAAPAVTAEAVTAMHSALGAVARLNSVDPTRPSWRHGSIAWRQAYLTSIVGRPLESLPIDRLIRRTKAAVAVMLVGAGAATVLLEWQATAGEVTPPALTMDPVSASRSSPGPMDRTP